MPEHQQIMNQEDKSVVMGWLGRQGWSYEGRLAFLRQWSNKYKVALLPSDYKALCLGIGLNEEKIPNA